MIKSLLRESLYFEGILNEVDWDSTFSDVKKTCFNIADLVDYLNTLKARNNIAYGDREKIDKKLPFIHGKSDSINKNNPDVDIQHFIKTITTPPKTIINTNDKILKSGGLDQYVYKTGLPAFRGIAYDVDADKFFVINTCPGAGSCVNICYAMKGNYIMYPNAYDSMTKRLNYLLNYPDKYENQLYNELKKICIEHKALIGYKSIVILRWNDSGDFFTKKYVDISKSVMKRLKSDGYNVKSYAYTKVSSVANDTDMKNITHSVGGSTAHEKSVTNDKIKKSIIVPKKIISGLDLDKISDTKIAKVKIANEFNLSVSDVLTYSELMNKKETSKPKWFVIVSPGDGDDAAFRDDVKSILLIQH